VSGQALWRYSLAGWFFMLVGVSTLTVALGGFLWRYPQEFLRLAVGLPSGGFLALLGLLFLHERKVQERAK
jgi:hypothetical protein